METSEIKSLLKQNGFRIVNKNPDMIVCYGGDGTILYAETNFPQIPKLVIKKSRICRKCDYFLQDMELTLRKIKEKKFKLQKEMKLETIFKKRKLIALNEIQVHAMLPTHAIRFSVSVDGRRLPNLIGDGIVVATPFGSTGYYKSTGGNQFKEGIGVSFNNLHNEKIESFVGPNDWIVKVTIDRGPAWVIADNNEELLRLRNRDSIMIKKSESVANFIYVQ
ncbi:MAG: hypothetical protein PVF96_03095 [Candidatus Bathyarchaeota archaeon]|jgi:NAD+ kinase